MKSDRDPRSGIRGAELGTRGPESPELPDGRDEQMLAEVDRELRRLLSAVPSPGFEARVLAGIAQDEVHGRSSSMWLAAAAALVLGAGLLFVLVRSPAIDTTMTPPMARHGEDVVLPSVRSQPPAIGEVRTRRVPHAGRVQSRPVRRPQPEVIVPLNQMEAVRRLVRAFNEGRVEAAPEAAGGPLAPPEEIAVPPLEVEPIPVPALDAGAAALPQPRKGV